jgi:hypothetical protein
MYIFLYNSIILEIKPIFFQTKIKTTESLIYYQEKISTWVVTKAHWAAHHGL